MKSKGYTLIEMLVTIAIIGVAMTLIIPGVQRIQASSRQAACVNNLRSIGQAAISYATDRQQLLPWYTNEEGYWWKALEPFVEANTKVFRCPADLNFKAAELDRTISYGWNYVLAGRGRVGQDPSDCVRPNAYTRPSTILLAADGPGGARSQQDDSWGFIDATAPHTPDPIRHRGNANALFLDGHIENYHAKFFIDNTDFADRTKNQL